MSINEEEASKLANAVAVHATATLMNCAGDQIVINELLKRHDALMQDADRYPEEMTDDDVMDLVRAYRELALVTQAIASRHRSYAMTMMDNAESTIHLQG